MAFNARRRGSTAPDGTKRNSADRAASPASALYSSRTNRGSFSRRITWRYSLPIEIRRNAPRPCQRECLRHGFRSRSSHRREFLIAEGGMSRPNRHCWSGARLNAHLRQLSYIECYVGIMTSYKGTSPMVLDVLGSRPKLRLLRYLSTHEGAFTGRALAQAAGVEAKRAAEALAALVATGVVQRRRAGRAFLYSINRNNYVVTEILLPAFLNERHWLERLGEEIRRSIPGIDSVILYGSWAKQKARSESDVDLLLVASPKSNRTRALQSPERIDDTRGRMSERYGRPVSLLLLDPAELRRRLRRHDPLLREIVTRGRVLAGRGLAEVISDE
jgi:predicted nucleotidyltransferase